MLMDITADGPVPMVEGRRLKGWQPEPRFEVLSACGPIQDEVAEAVIDQVPPDEQEPKEV